MSSSSFSAVEQIFTKGTWYHTFEFNGLKSPGTFDYTQKIKNLKYGNLQKHFVAYGEK